MYFIPPFRHASGETADTHSSLNIHLNLADHKPSTGKDPQCNTGEIPAMCSGSHDGFLDFVPDIESIQSLKKNSRTTIEIEYILNIYFFYIFCKYLKMTIQIT